MEELTKTTETKQSFIKKLKEGYKKLTPLDHARAKKSGHQWAIIGGALAIGVMFYRGVWYFALFLGAIIWLQYVELRKEKQKIDGIIKMQEQMDQQTNIKNDLDRLEKIGL
ncbi:hypothetical protein LCGC14_1661880 [marine sediment metagenome]|uniref:DUF202 domain-containing protein n=1 Tax=marine sediment metagenome TaxID=412755 RepID=A0A0F9HUG6_9ZZZZ